MDTVILVLAIILPLIFFIPVLAQMDIEKEEILNNSTLVVVDKFITYTRTGFPCFYIVYQLEDGSLKALDVNETKYYETIVVEEGV